MSKSKYDPLDMALSLGKRPSEETSLGPPTATEAPTRPPTARGASTSIVESSSRRASQARGQLNVRVLETTRERLRRETAPLAATHSTGDVIDWLVEHHLADAVEALGRASDGGRRVGVRPRR